MGEERCARLERQLGVASAVGEGRPPGWKSRGTSPLLGLSALSFPHPCFCLRLPRESQPPASSLWPPSLLPTVQHQAQGQAGGGDPTHPSFPGQMRVPCFRFPCQKGPTALSEQPGASSLPESWGRQ